MINELKWILCLFACIGTLNPTPARATQIMQDGTEPQKELDAVPNHPSTQDLIRDAVELIENRARTGLERDGVGGVTVGIVIGNELVWTKSFGDADESTNTPASRSTIYRIASISKSFTGLMLAQLVEDGIVQYSDPASLYLPELNAMQNPWSNSSPITLLQLANMTAGVQREPDNVHAHGYLFGSTSEWESKTLKAMTETRIVHEPGTRYAYSNMGYSMLGIAMGRASKTPFIEYQLSKIITPLGMTNTVFDLNDDLRNRLATGYIRNPDGTIDTQRAQSKGNDYGYKVACGGLYTTVDDLAKFVSLQLGHGPNKVIDLSGLTRTHTGFQSNSDLSYGYGIGLTATRRGDRVFIGNLGGVYGFASAMYFHPKSGAGVIVLRNATGDVFREDTLCFDALEQIVTIAEPQIDSLIASAHSAFDSHQWNQAVLSYDALIARSFMSPRDMYQFGFSLFAQGSDLQRAIYWLNVSYDLENHRADSAYFTASCYALLDETDSAFDWLDRAKEAGADAREFIAQDPNLRNLHEDQRFEEFLSQLPTTD